MRKWVIGALLAATAWAPALAQDEEGGGRRNQWQQSKRGGQNEGQPFARPQRQERAPDQVRPQADAQAGGGWQGRRDRGAQAGVQAQTQAGGWQGRRGGGEMAQRPQGNWQGRREGQRDPAVSRTDPAQAQTERYDARSDWNRDRTRSVQPDRFDRTRNGQPDRFDRNRNGQPDRFDRNRDGRADAYGRDARGQWGGQQWGNGRYDNRSNDRWSRNWRQDNRFDWNRYRSSNRSAYRLPRYYAPYGWDYGYRRFSIGVTLSSVLWGQNYWIDDPYEYRLPPAYGPYRWVRYFNDALLVDLRTGLVVDTVYDIFWY